ncbi:MAG: type II toxin-antitoxin system VapC family toxin [Candidatus Aenigmatarchaeota archaeon]
MRFLDTNFFIYAYYKPKRQLTQKEMEMKTYAKKIISDISEGKEKVITTVAHISEVTNILKRDMPLEQLNHFILGLFMLDNIEIYGVSKEVYFAATELGEDLKLDPNDALAIYVMRLNNINEIYSFDEDFNKVEGIYRLPKL